MSTWATASAQEVSVDLWAGRLVYAPLSTRVEANTTTGTLRYESGTRWVYGTTNVPFRGADEWWGAVGAGGRFQLSASPRSRVHLGADAGVHAYMFRDAVGGGRGAGSTIDALPFVAVSGAGMHVEFRGGWRGHTLAYAGARESRGVVELGTRVSHGRRLRLQGEATWVRSDEGRYPFAGASLAYVDTPVQMWMRAGRWLSPELQEVSWDGGLGVAVGPRTTIWTRAWQEAPDPLYWSVTRRNWGVGVTHRFGRSAPLMSPAARSRRGVVFAVSASEAQGAMLWVAGDFNAWQPIAMRRTGDGWIAELPLDPGIYRYAFRSDDNRWFVPRSVASRRDDGWGGEVAVLVVTDDASR